MPNSRDLLVLIPARAGSEGLPGKNTRRLLGRPLVAYSMCLALELAQLENIVVSTDDPLVVECARQMGLVVDRLRPTSLSGADVSMAAVVRYEVERFVQQRQDFSGVVLLLDPTSPLRSPTQIGKALSALEKMPHADGIISVSKPHFNPNWVGVQLGNDGWLNRHPSSQSHAVRRQDVEPFWRINGNFYLWKLDWARQLQDVWIDNGNFLGWEIPDEMGYSIDSSVDFRLVEAILSSGLIELGWMSHGDNSR